MLLTYIGCYGIIYVSGQLCLWYICDYLFDVLVDLFDNMSSIALHLPSLKPAARCCVIFAWRRRTKRCSTAVWSCSSASWLRCASGRSCGASKLLNWGKMPMEVVDIFFGGIIAKWCIVQIVDVSMLHVMVNLEFLWQVVVAHCDLIGSLTEKMGLKESDMWHGWTICIHLLPQKTGLCVHGWPMVTNFWVAFHRPLHYLLLVEEKSEKKPGGFRRGWWLSHLSHWSFFQIFWTINAMTTW